WTPTMRATILPSLRTVSFRPHDSDEHPRPGLAVVDAGLKALGLDSGMPLVWNGPELTFAGAADEHGRLVVAEGAQAIRGERIRLVPGHCDPTVDCYDWYVGCRVVGLNVCGLSRPGVG